MHLSGSITALATPFTAAGGLDLDAWDRLLAAQLAGGTQGVVVAGSTGEAAALEDEEYATLVARAVAALGGRIPVLAGTGASSTARTIAQTRRAAAAGAEAALVVVPPYVRPTQPGMVAHFQAVAAQGGLPVVVYNVPGRTGSDLLPATVAQLLGTPGIIGIKEAVDDPARMEALVALRQPGFAVLTGDDGTACRAMLAGADGLVSVGSNAAPAAFRALCDLARGGDAERARGQDARMRELFAFLGVESNPIPLKALLQRQGIGAGLRLPLLPLSTAHHDLADRMAALVATLDAEASRGAIAA